MSHLISAAVGGLAGFIMAVLFGHAHLQSIRRDIERLQYRAPAAQEPMRAEEIATWTSVPIFEGVNPDQLRWIVQKTEERHGIGEKK